MRKVSPSPPSVEEIKEYFRVKRPLGMGDEPIVVVDIDPKPISGHFNFLVESDGRKVVFRLKGPEWGEPEQGTVDEYQTLKAVEPYAVGPRPLLLDEHGFVRPILIEEYLEGTALTEFPEGRQRGYFPAIVELIVRINSIPVERGALPFQEPFTGYERHKRTWRERLAVVAASEACGEWHQRAADLLPAADRMLDTFELQLKRVIEQSGPVFIFESAHAGHCVVTVDGPRFLNWEQVSYGDPAFTLAVFLASINDRLDFDEVKREMIAGYLDLKDVPGFAELVEQRLAEREVSNLTWALWAPVRRGETGSPGDTAGAARHYERAKKLLQSYM